MGEPSLPRHTITGFAQHVKEKLKPGGNKDDEPEKGKAAQRSELKRKEKQEKEERLQQEKDDVEERWQKEDEKAQQGEDGETRSRYGTKTDAEDLPTHPHELLAIEDVAHLPVGTEVAFRARIHTQRRISPMLDFLLFRDQTHSMQGVLSHTSPHMIRWVQRLHPESLVHVTGTLKEPHESVRSATHSDVEVDIYSIHLLNPANDLPWDNYEPPESLHTRLQARVLDLRHPSNQAVFRIRSMIVRKFREVLEDDGFLEIQTPKLQPAATESGAEVFKVNYFGRTAFLAQSPQLAKQMSISADLKKVYEVSFLIVPKSR
jgi:lysyl-tRNA synthetase class II